jgi:hypothetical protein
MSSDSRTDTVEELSRFRGLSSGCQRWQVMVRYFLGVPVQCDGSDAAGEAAQAAARCCSRVDRTAAYMIFRSVIRGFVLLIIGSAISAIRAGSMGFGGGSEGLRRRCGAWREDASPSAVLTVIVCSRVSGL